MTVVFKGTGTYTVKRKEKEDKKRMSEEVENRGKKSYELQIVSDRRRLILEMFVT